MPGERIAIGRRDARADHGLHGAGTGLLQLLGKSWMAVHSVCLVFTKGDVMGIEVTMLAWSVILGLVLIALAATGGIAQRGVIWAISSREGKAAALSGVAGRLARGAQNFLETFPLFAVAVLALLVLGKEDAMSALGVQLYFWSRVAYALVYAAGINYLRTVVWAVSIAGIVLVLIALL